MQIISYEMFFHLYGEIILIGLFARPFSQMETWLASHQTNAHSLRNLPGVKVTRRRFLFAPWAIATMADRKPRQVPT